MTVYQLNPFYQDDIDITGIQYWEPKPGNTCWQSYMHITYRMKKSEPRTVTTGTTVIVFRYGSVYIAHERPA